MTVDVYEELRREALALIDSSGIDPSSDPVAARDLLELTVDEYQSRAHLGRWVVACRPERDRRSTDQICYWPRPALESS